MCMSLLKLARLQKIDVELKRQANLKYCTRFGKQWRSKCGASGGIQCWAQALWAHKHTLQSFKNTFLSRNLDQNMLKNALFFGKKWKNWRSVGGFASQTPVGSLKLLFLLNLHVIFGHCANFLTSSKLKLQLISYLSDI